MNTLKIDRSFVIHLGQTNKNDAIIRIVGGLAHELQLQLIAEGVEERYQIDALKKLGYQWGQGYYFSPPVDAQAFTILLQKNIDHIVE